MAKSLIIIGSSYDAHTRLVAERLLARDKRVFYFDPLGDFRITGLCPDGFGSSTIEAVNFASGALERVRASESVFWWRNKARVRHLISQEDRNTWYCLGETLIFLSTFLAEASATVFNASASRLYAARKPTQLRLAKQAGLNVCPTLVSNDLEAIRAFARDFETVVVKALGAGDVPSTEDGALSQILYTRPTTYDELGTMQAEEFAGAPVIVQPLLPRLSELRVITVGGKSLGYRFTPHSLNVQTDWRQVHHLGKFEPVELDGRFAASCARYNELAGLFYSVFDFAESAEKQPTFFESNVDGQWGWLEERTAEKPISDVFSEEIARRLLS